MEYNPQDPKFYTFMTTDSEGFNSFIHVLIFYDEVNEAEINSDDFDIVAEILRKKSISKKHQSTRIPAGVLNNSQRDGSNALSSQKVTIKELNKEG